MSRLAGRPRSHWSDVIDLDELGALEGEVIDTWPDGAVGAGPEMRALRRRLVVAAETFGSVFVYGERGSGQASVARAIHEGSSHRDAPFLRLAPKARENPLRRTEGACRSRVMHPREVERPPRFVDEVLPLVDRARGGTLLIDDVNVMPQEDQLDLARILKVERRRPQGEEVRFMACSSKLMREARRDGDIVDDLFYLLSTWVNFLPPLRMRPRDVPLLAVRMLHRRRREGTSRVRAIARSALLALEGHPWPGNVEELGRTLDWILLRYPDLDVVRFAHVRSCLLPPGDVPELGRGRYLPRVDVVDSNPRDAGESPPMGCQARLRRRRSAPSRHRSGGYSA